MLISETIRIRRGLNINLLGKADRIFLQGEKSSLYAIKPTDFIGITPKLTVKPGDIVKIGSTLFYDKKYPDIKFTAPVSGKVSEIIRGERRRILAVIMESDGTNDYIEFKKADPSELSKNTILETILESGMWPAIRQRPYAVIANPSDTPKSIFISGFDTAPLAPDYNFLLNDFAFEFQKGIDALIKLTTGKIHLSIDNTAVPAKAYTNVSGVEVHKFEGPHPAGNVGIQIHHIDPINKGDIVWYIGPLDVVRIGKLFIDGKVDNTALIAVVGSEVKKPAYHTGIRGTSIGPLIKNNINKGEVRYISGNVLTGSKIEKDDFIGYYDNQLSVIPEGKYYDFLGWALPGFGKYSTSRSFFSWLLPSKEYRLDTNLKGGRRSYVLTGEYEKVLPMDIYPVHLIKAILAEDIEKMENLGIYEIAEEDFALCEFVCTSKTEVQSIIRKGLDLVKKEME